MVIEARYRDGSLPVADRVADLIDAMTVPEKIAQLGSVWSFEIIATDTLDPDRMARMIGHGIGEISRVAGGTNQPAAEVARLVNEIQRYLVEETRLGIPAIMHEESLHGVLASDAFVFQQSIGAAATWDPGLVEAVATTIRRRLLASGARHALAPVLDLARDPRWGRIEETYGEDPYLAAAMGIAYVRGVQGPSLAGGIMATGKHLIGHGLPEGGLNQAPAHMGRRELLGEQLFPFEAAVRTAGLASVMPAYCDVDGVPCHASVELLRTVLREEWAFDGIVASDYDGIRMLSTLHRITDDLGLAAGLGLRAGVDLELPKFAAYAEPLERALEDGSIDPALLDEAVARVLTAKFRMGLFERPYVEIPSPATIANIETSEREVGGQLARRSIVLVSNDGILPLSPAVPRVALIGPIADSARDLLGDYSHLTHIETLLEIRKGLSAFGFAVDADVSAVDEVSGRQTILDAIRRRLPDGAVRYAAGCGITDGTDEQIAEAVAAARDADVAVVVLGERSGLTIDATTGESRDRLSLGFIGRQQELLAAVAATGTPVVLVVVSGRPLAIEQAAGECAAIMLVWTPGDDGPAAIADVLFGDVNPGGKLPVTVPRHVGQVPLTYRHHPSGGRSQWKGDYVDGPVSPLWPFGFGLSYTSFELSNLRLDQCAIATDGGEVTVSVDVRNTGTRAGDEVAQLYVRDEEASVARPVLELAGFARVGLSPGECRTVSWRLSAEQLSYFGADYRRIVEPGRVRLFVGTSAADLPLCASLELVGPVVDLPDRQRFLTPVSIS